MTAKERSVILDVMVILEAMPCGGIGPAGASLKEIEESNRAGQALENDAMYHQAQSAWRLLESLLK